MNKIRNGSVGTWISVFVLLAIAGPAAAQESGASVTQILDSVTVLGGNFGIGLDQDEPPGFDELFPIDTTLDLVDCDANTALGIACLDQDKVRIWPNLSNPTTSSVLFSCMNSALPVNTRKGNPCTAIARDTLGNVFIGARRNGTANVVIKVTGDPNADGTGCSAGFTPFVDNSNYLCFAELATGRPIISDIDVIESGDKRLLVLEEKKTALIYSNFEPDPTATQVDELASGKRDFNLNGNEKVINAAFMEYVRPTDAAILTLERQGESDFFVIAATDRGRLIAVNTAGSPSGVEVFNLASLVDPAIRTEPVCAAEEDSFDVTISTKSNLGYATDRNYCSLHVLVRQWADNGDFAAFAPSTDPASPLSTSITVSPPAAAIESTTFYPPLFVSVSPGIGFDLESCFPNCDLIGDGAASLADVQVASEESNVTLFQIAGIPHCAWIPQTCYEILTGTPATSRMQAIAYLMGEDPGASHVDVLRELDPPVPGRPAEGLIFNVTPLLPEEVTDRFQILGEPPNGLPILPPLLLPPEYRAQIRAERQFRFNALFFVPEPGVVTDGVLTLEVDVSELTDGTELGCVLAPDLDADYDLDELLAWDVVVRVSEQWRSADGQFDPPEPTPIPLGEATFQGSTVNAGCRNPTRSRSGGISIFPIDLEVTPCPLTFNATTEVWVSDGVCVADGTNNPVVEESPDDSVFAKLYVKLYDELLAHLQELACTNTDTGDPLAPLSSSDCAALEASWFNGKDKLVKALAATFEPKSSSGNENFGAVQSQLQNYSNMVNAALPYGPDPANRTGEQAARVETLQHILVDKLLPSIPDDGFDDADITWAQ